MKKKSQLIRFLALAMLPTFFWISCGAQEAQQEESKLQLFGDDVRIYCEWIDAGRVITH